MYRLVTIRNRSIPTPGHLPYLSYVTDRNKHLETYLPYQSCVLIERSLLLMFNFTFICCPMSTTKKRETTIILQNIILSKQVTGDLKMTSWR